MLFDSHAHYEDEKFDGVRDELIRTMHGAGVAGIINAGSDIETSVKSIELAHKYPFIYAAVGVHPEEADRYDREKIAELAGDERVVSIGEIGLDYHWEENPDRKTQKEAFVSQLLLAHEFDLPVEIHSRDAAADTFELVKSSPCKKGMMHAFSGSLELAREYIKLGFYISVGGVVTFKNGRKLAEVVKEIPLDRFLIETDSPYLSPEPNRGKTNNSTNLKFIAEKIAELKSVSYDDVVRVTEENARALFGI